ncbi:molybdopterin-dependent oxidoreductase [Myxococcota bacterium]|nr:molybdopterin-dependent oxidoreductase [Myxococcota bacterium]
MSEPRWFQRSCPICEASCSLKILADREQREVLRIEGNADDPISRGHLCPKAYALKWVYEDPDRLRGPIRRVGRGADARWEAIEWSEAFDYAAERIQAVQAEHGPQALGAYIGNPSGFEVGASVFGGVFSAALKTTRFFSAATMDHFPKLVTSRILYGRANILPIPDIDRCDYFLCLGGNPMVSQGSLMSAPDMRGRLRALRERGGKLVVVDPRRTETADVSDEHLFIKPGADALWLFALVHVLFAEGLVAPGRFLDFTDGIDEVAQAAEEFSPEAVAAATGIAPDVTRRIAREFSAAERACCYGRIGTCTVEFGMLTSWLIDVLGILTGHFDTPGGMMFPRPPLGQVEPGAGGRPFQVGRWKSVAKGHPEINGQLPCAAIAEEIDAGGDERMRAFVTIAGNPVLSTPNGPRLDRALASLDFMLSIDLYLNETTRHADLILPTLTQLEVESFDALTSTTSVRNFARLGERVFDPEPGLLSHAQVVLEIAARLQGTTAEALEQQVLYQEATRAVKRHPETSTEQAVASVGDEPGPLRVVDLMLRGGPYGRGFADTGEGLDLAHLQEAGCAVDLGPLEPRFPELLRGEGQRIPLAHPYLMGDLPRLRAGLAQRSEPDQLVLVGRRQARNMNSWLHNFEGLARGRNRCTLLVHPDDATRLELRDGGQARITSRVGEVVAEVEVTDTILSGVVSLPHGFGHDGAGTKTGVATTRQPGANANALTDDELFDTPTGTSVANGFPVQVSAV